MAKYLKINGKVCLDTLRSMSRPFFQVYYVEMDQGATHRTDSQLVAQHFSLMQGNSHAPWVSQHFLFRQIHQGTSWMQPYAISFLWAVKCHSFFCSSMTFPSLSTARQWVMFRASDEIVTPHFVIARPSAS